MDNEMVDQVKQIVSDLTAESKTFTAFDVTKILRNEKGLDARHYEVRQVLNGIWSDNGMPWNYTRVLHSFQVDGQDVQARLYMDNSNFPDSYDPNALGMNSTPDLVADPDPATDPSDPDPSADPFLTTDKRGRLCIPNKVTKEIGLDPGDIVSLFTLVNHPGVAVLSEDFCHNSRQFKVDKSGNVRISHRTLQRLGLAPVLRFVAESDGDAIITIKTVN